MTDERAEIRARVPKYQLRTAAKWNKENLDRIGLYIRKGGKERIKAAAEAAGDSLNHYIIEAVEIRMEAEEAAVDFDGPRMGEADDDT